ncbi:response regulator [Cohnella fermenti]|uniref:Response regulator n=1 Tax=Cohnella fermenti TaxID=2565925 RepID=A0A4S4BKI9_9BACL|nr:response regulator [Cohnella fermenti]THF75015.1 response regulator [Cohnella fermenti]
MIHIAVVDDEERIRLGLAKLIEQCGEAYKVVGCFASGQELLAELGRLAIDLIVTDIKMPQMNGLQLIEKVQQRKPKIKFAIVSGFNDFSFARQAIRQGVEDYLLKPVDRKELAELLSRIKNNLELERYRKAVAIDEHIRLLLRNDLRKLPEHMIQGATRDLGQTSLLREHFAVLAVRTEPELPAEQVEGYLAHWSREFRLIAWEPRQAVILASIGQHDHYDTVRELGLTLMRHFPPGVAVRIGMSDIHQGALRLREAYLEAEASVQFCWYDKGIRATALHSSSKRTAAECGYHPAKLLDKELRPALQVLDFARADAVIEEWLGELQGSRPAWPALAEGCGHLFELIDEEKQERQGGTGELTEQQIKLAPALFPDWPAFRAALQTAAREQLGELKNMRQENRVVETVKTYIQGHYIEELELQRLADIVFLTPSYLSKLFKTATGETITDYVISVRIEKAKETLSKHPEMKTYEVGERVGYSDPAYFNKVFKKVTGFTPKEYRDRVRL